MLVQRFPVRVKEGLFQRKLTEKQMYEICTQLRFALEGELSLPLSLTMMEQEAPAHTEKCFLGFLARRMEAGVPLSEALQDCPIGYPDVFLQFITAGEQNGNMTTAIREGEQWFQHRQQLRKQFFSTMIYPIVVLAMTVVSFGLLLIMTGPVIRETYRSLDAPMPILTEKLLTTGDFMVLHWRVILVAVLSCMLIAYCMFQFLLRKPEFLNRWNRMVSAVPLLGSFYQKFWFVQIGQTIGVLLESGLLPADAISAACRIYKNSVFRFELLRMEEKIRNGDSFAETLKSAVFLPEMAGKMITITEQTGDAGRMLLSLSRYYQQLLEYHVRLMASVMEPVMIIFLGIGIMLIAGSLFLPMIESYQYLLL